MPSTDLSAHAGHSGKTACWESIHLLHLGVPEGSASKGRVCQAETLAQ